MFLSAFCLVGCTGQTQQFLVELVPVSSISIKVTIDIEIAEGATIWLVAQGKAHGDSPTHVP